MWGKRRKRRTRLQRQLALGLLEDAMGQVQQPCEPGEDESTVATYPGSPPAPAAPPARGDLRTADVPVDNSAGRGSADTPAAPQNEVPVQRTRDSTRHCTLGNEDHFRANGNLQPALS
jgi:hypothetical protein